ncbi:MAG: hypothetical protein ABTQ73_13425 [Caldilineales bacterium]
MVTQAVKEVFTLINLLCGGLVFLGLLLYALRGARPRNVQVLLILGVVIFVCLFNAVSVYLLL